METQPKRDDPCGKPLSHWLDFLSGLPHFENPHRFDNLSRLATLLQLTQWTIPIITIGGTNGKGSSAYALETIYRAQGYQTGVYTSPHLFSVTERVRLNAKPVAEDVLSRAFAALMRCQPEPWGHFFDYFTLAALLIFKQHNLDVLILEVGMGGRWDATNICDADVSLMTSIGLDHQQYLGNTREQIATEKAGILRPYQNFFCADEAPPHTLNEACQKLGLKMQCINQDFHIHRESHTWDLRLNQGHDYRGLSYPKIKLSNAALAICAMDALQARLPVSLNALQAAMIDVEVLGRCQVLSNHPRVIADVAHNQPSVEYLAKVIEDEQYERLLVVFSSLEDKNTQIMMQILKSSAHYWYLAALNHPRASSCQSLAACAARLHLNYQCLDSVEQAFTKAKQQAGPNDLIVVYGSFATLAEAVGMGV